MKKTLKVLALMAVMAVPWAAGAQNTLTTCNGTANNEYVPFYGYYADESQHNQLIYPADSLTAMIGQAITQMAFHIDPSAGNGSYTAADRMGTWTVSLGPTTATTLSGIDNATALTEVYQGYFDCSSGTLTLPFSDNYVYTGGNLLVDIQHAAASWNRWYFLGVNATGASYCYNSQRNFLPKVTFSYSNPPSCIRPDNMTATNVTSNGLTLVWSDPMNTGATYSIDYWKQGGDTNTVTSTDTTYTFTGLDANSLYHFAVKAICSPSDESNPLNGSFATACGGSTCDLTVTAAGQYSGSSYSPTLTVFQNGIQLASVNSSTQTVSVCSTDTVTIIYTEASYTWYPRTATVLDGGGTTLFSGSTENYSTGDVLLSIATPCPSCIPPMNLTTLPDSNQIEFSWTPRSGASQFIVYLGDSVVDDNVTDTFYTFTNLTANTPYTVKVQSVCSSSDSSSIVSRSVRTACGQITLPYSVDFEDVAYNGAWYPCWDSTIHAGTDPSVNNVRNHTSGGTYGMYLQATSSESYNLVVSPQIPTAGNNIYVRFWAYRSNGWIKAGVMTNPYDTSTFIPMVTINSGSGWNEYEFRTDTLDASATYYVAWLAHYSTSYSTAIGEIDDIYISEAPTCARITEVAQDTATDDGMTISWVDDVNSNATYTVYYWKDGTTDTLTVSATDTTATISGLDASSAYNVIVVANCGSDDAEASPVFTFRTACGPMVVPFFDNFDSYANGYWPPCWHRLRNHGTDPSVNAQYHHSGSQSMFLLADNDTTLFCTPSAVPLDGDDIYVRYWAYLTYASYYNETKWIKAGVMTDTSDMSTFIALDSVGYHNFNNVFEEREFTTATLDHDSVYFVAWMFYSTNNGYGSYNRGGIDDVYISALPTCLRVSSVAVADADSNSITINWVDDANNGATYTVKVGDSIAATGVTDTFYTVTGLNANTQYTLSVTVECGSDNSEAVSVTGRTTCVGYAIPYSYGFESATDLACWNEVIGSSYGGGRTSGNASTGSYSYLFYYGSQSSLTSPLLTGTENGLKVQFKYKRYSSYYSEGFMVGYSTTGNDNSSFIWGPEVTDATESYQTYEAIFPAGVKFVSVKYTTINNYGIYLDDFNFMLPPACMPVTLLTVDTTTADGATIHWTAPAGASNFIVRLNDSIDYNTTDTFYSFSGLAARSPFTVSVATDCSGDTSDWVSTSFVTGCANGECEITVAMTDQYGDGWNGNAVEVYQNNALVGSATLTTGNSGTATVSVCAIMPVEFRFHQGSYADEVSFTILDGGEETIYTAAQGSMSSTATGAVLTTVTDACPTCLKPANVIATLIDSNDLAFSWTVDPLVIEYLVSFNGGAWQSNTIGTYNATGLNPNTAYTFSVKAHCSAYDTSNARTITVKTSCGQMVLPYVESFEGDAQGNVPSCWTVVRPGYNNYPAVSGSEHTGNNGMTLAAAYNDSTTIATSLVPLAGDSIHVSFWASVNAGNTLQAGVMTDLAYDSTFMPLLTIPSNGSTYTLYEFNTTSLGTAYSYTNFYVAFRLVTGSSNYYADIDDINISLDEGCMHPTNLTATTTSSSINLTWSANGVSMGTYVVQNKISGTNDWDTAGVTNDTTFNVTGLNPATSYVLRVGLICGSDTLWVSVSAVTDCAILPLPYSENFDAYAENVLPPCWTYDASGVTHYDGGLFFRSYSAGGDGAYAVVPELNGNFNKLQIEFDTKVGTIAEQDGILIGTADAAGTLIGWLDTIQDANHSRNAFVHHTINMLNYVIPYGSARLVFAQYRNWNEWALIDNLNIIELPDCLPVDSIAIFNVEDPDHTSFTWVNMGYETQWQVYVDTVTANIDSIPDSLFTTVNTMSYTIPMGTIQGGGIYTFYVRADCELEQSNWVSYTFGAGSVVMNNSSVADTVVGCGLVVYDNGGPIAGYLPNSNSALVIRSENAGSELEVFGGAFGFGSSSATLTIYDGEGTNGTVLYTYSVIDGRDTIDSVLATSTTGALTITFTSSGQMCHTGYELYIHCVGTAVCPRPTQVQGEMTGVGEATLRWVGNSASYDVYYKLSGASVWSTQNTTADSLNLTGLVPDTVYDFYVVGICGSETSTPSFVVQLNTTFEVVIEPCDPATDLSYSNVTTTEATLDWVSNGSEWQVEVKHLNVTDTLTVNTKPYTLTNLLPTMQYNVRVRTVCSGLYVEPYSDWSNTVTFTTMTPGPGPGSIDNAEDGMLAIYPNPASTVVNISVAMDGMVNLSLVDMNGRTVYSQNGNEGQFSIDVSMLAKGAYFVRVVGEQATSVRKLIVR